MYNLKWIPTNFFKCSTCWHIFYITLIRYRFSPLFCKDHDLISSSYQSQKQGWWRKSKKYSYFLENRLKVISLNIYAKACWAIQLCWRTEIIFQEVDKCKLEVGSMLGKVPPCSSLLSPSPHLPHGACLPHPTTSIVLVLPRPPLCPGDLNYFGCW